MSIDMMTKAEFDTGEVVLNYAEGPKSGPALVLLHGGSARWQYFDPILPDLAARWHVFALDLRGHGRSGRTPGRYTLRDYAEDTGAFLHRVSGPAWLFGHSLGGMVALMAAEQFPDDVKAVVVGDAPLDAESWQAHITPAAREQLRGWQALAGGAFSIEEIMARLREAPAAAPGQAEPVRMRDVYGEDNGVYAHLAERLYEHDPDMIRMLLDETNRVAQGYQLETFGPRIQCPVLLLQADPAAGGVMQDEDVTRALKCLPRASHRLLPGVSHLLFHDDKDVVVEASDAFRQEVETGAV